MPSAYDLDRIRAKLAGRQPLVEVTTEAADALASSGGLNAVVQTARVAPHRRAAVAAILRPSRLGNNDTEVLLIRRAERVGDPWSGHMAFPGGHQEPADPDSYTTAVRETREEIGLELREHEYLGALDEVPATIRGMRVGISIVPHVFAMRGGGEASLRPNYEVAEIVWAELGPMARGEVDAIKEWKHEGQVHQAPGFQVDRHVVWGLTHRMLLSLFDVLA